MTNKEELALIVDIEARKVIIGAKTCSEAKQYCMGWLDASSGNMDDYDYDAMVQMIDDIFEEAANGRYNNV